MILVSNLFKESGQRNCSLPAWRRAYDHEVVILVGHSLSCATGVWLMLPQQYTINSYQEQKCNEWITHYQMCSHLVSASSLLSQPETLIPQMMAQHSKLSGTTTGCQGCKLYKHWLIPTRRTHTRGNTNTQEDTHTLTTTAIVAASSMCYFANCNPGQDNKMASRQFVNISVLAQSAPGRLLTDRCVDWFFFFFSSSFFFFTGALPWFARLRESK